MEKDNGVLLTYPLPHTPPAWNLNPIFLNILKKSHSHWVEQGYEWQFGLECSFRLRPSHELLFRKMDEAKIAKVTKSPVNGVLYDATRRIARRPNLELYAKTLQNLKTQSASIAADNLLPEQNVLEDLEGFQKDLSSNARGEKMRARQNIYLGWLHATPSSEGGLRDLIEPRFGDYLHGVGWWDADIHAEVRIPKTSDPLKLIEIYHKILANIVDSAPRFGFAPAFIHTPHIHFSIWKDGKALLSPVDKTRKFRQDVAMGLADIADKAPYLMNDPGRSYCDSTGVLEFASFRVESGFRQLEDRWEWRRHNGETEIGFLARDLAVLLSGGALAISTPDVKAPFQKFKKSHAFAYRKQPDAVHIFGDQQSSLRAAVSHSVIDKKGFLRPQGDVLKWMHYSLLKEVGRHATSDFQGRSFDFEPLFDLNTVNGWRELFKTLKIEDQKLVTSHLSPELQSLFKTLEIKGTNSFIESKPFNLTLEPHNFLSLLEKQKPFIARCSMEKEDWQTIREHYLDFYQRGMQQQAAFIVNGLSREFARAAADLEDPKPIILKAMRNIRETTAHELFMQLITAGEGELQFIGEEEIVTREKMLEGGCLLSFLQPHFRQAVADKITQCRASELPDNRQISFLQSTLEYTDTKWFDCSDTVEGSSYELIDRIQNKILNDEAGWIDVSLSKLTYASCMDDFINFKVYDQSISDENLRSAFAEAAQAWRLHFDKLREETFDDLKESPLWQKFCDELVKRRELHFKHLDNLAARLVADKKESLEKLDPK